MALPGMLGAASSIGKSHLSPRSGVPWATDDQWGALKAEATRLSLDMERKALGLDDRSRTASRRSTGLVDGKKQSQVDAMPAGEQAKSSVFWAPAKGVNSRRLEDNLYEGVLGPTLGESCVAGKQFSRVDVSKLIKTPKEVWKAGKQPTQTFAGTLPGSHSEQRAGTRTPSYLRGLPSRKRMDGAESSEEAEQAASRPGSGEDFQTSLYMLELADERSRSSMRGDSAGGRTTPGEGSLESEVVRLKAEYSRLRNVAKEREAELERLQTAQGKTNVDQEMVDEVDVLLEDFRARAEARSEMQEGRLEGVIRQRAALQEVERRLKLVNKGLNHRLHQTKEELRVYNTDIKDMSGMCKEVQANRDQVIKTVRQLKQQMTEDGAQREGDLTRRQAIVQKCLRETNELGMTVKANQERREREEAEREAERELAQMRAYENGTSVLHELEIILQRKQEGRQGELSKALKSIYDKSNTLSAEGALQYLGERMHEHSRLMGDREELEARIESLKRQQLHSAAAKRAVEGVYSGEHGSGEAEMKELEDMLSHIEAFGDNSRILADAMSKLILQYVEWAVAMLVRLVNFSNDDVFLKAARRLSRSIPGDGASDELLRSWVSRALPLIHNTVHDMLDLVQDHDETHQQSPQRKATGSLELNTSTKQDDSQLALPPPRGPDAGDKPVIKSISGAHKLQVRRDSAGGGQMAVLAPHSGFNVPDLAVD